MAERQLGEMPCSVTGDAHHVLSEKVELTTGLAWENRCRLCHEVWWIHGADLPRYALGSAGEDLGDRSV